MKDQFDYYYKNILYDKFKFYLYATKKCDRIYNDISYDIMYYINKNDSSKDHIILSIIHSHFYNYSIERYTSYDKLTKRLNSIFKIELRKNKLQSIYYE